MNKSKIEWCDRTWNPITGCLHNCPYCYARTYTRRFCTNEHGKEGLLSPCSGDCRACSEMDGVEFIGDQIRVSHGNGAFPFGFYPTFHLNRMSRPAGVKKPQNVFVCSMSDLFGEWVPDEYIKRVFDACAAAPWHRYLFLTKNPKRYAQFGDPIVKGVESWIGQTLTGIDKNPVFLFGTYAFVSIEPILAPIDKILYQDVGWVIIGAETGHRTGAGMKVTPKREWIEAIVKECRKYGIPVFLKKSLADVWGESLIQEYPWCEEKQNA